MSAEEHVRSPFAIVPWEVAADRRLTQRHLRVLIALLSFRRRDTGPFFATRAQIAERCGLPETRISNATTELEALGWLVKHGAGRVAVRYEFRLPETITEMVTVTDPVTVTKPVTVKPSTVTKTVTQRLPNRSHSDNHTESHIGKDNKQCRKPNGKKLDLSQLPPGISVSLAEELIDYRKNIIKRPLTQRAFDSLVAELAKAQSVGVTPEKALEIIQVKGWRGFQVSWLQNEQSEIPGDGDPVAKKHLRRLGGAA